MTSGMGGRGFTLEAESPTASASRSSRHIQGVVDVVGLALALDLSCSCACAMSSDAQGPRLHDPPCPPTGRPVVGFLVVAWMFESLASSSPVASSPFGAGVLRCFSINRVGERVDPQLSRGTHAICTSTPLLCHTHCLRHGALQLLQSAFVGRVGGVARRCGVSSICVVTCYSRHGVSLCGVALPAFGIVLSREGRMGPMLQWTPKICQLVSLD